jgi:CBS-domain-containing membrane protein
MKVKDVMVCDYDYLKPDNTLSEAVNLFWNIVHGDQRLVAMGLSVLDAKGKLVGMLSMTDVIKAVYPSYMSMMNLGEFTWDGMLEDLARQGGNRKVKDIMTSPVITVREDDPLMECVDLILRIHIREMPVLDKAGKMVGMVYLQDIFYAITRAMLDEDSGGVK